MLDQSGFHLSVESNSRSLWFCMTTLSDWPKMIGSPHFLNQSEVKPKPIVTRPRTFSRVSRQLHVFSSNFDWFTGFSVNFVIGRSDYFGFGLRQSNDFAYRRHHTLFKLN